MPVTAAHQILRSATAAAHTRLDALFGGFDLTRRASYAEFLAAHADALLPTERWLDADGRGERVAVDWPNRRRTRAILADLADLGIASAEPAPVALLDMPAAVSGVLYVLEGSRLGGRVLIRGVPTDFPRRYLSPSDGQPSWPSLLSAIDATVTADNADQAVTAALAVFALFEGAGTARLERAVA